MKIKTMLAGVLCSGLLACSVNAAGVEFFVGAAAGYQTDIIEGNIIMVPRICRGRGEWGH